MEAPQAPPGPRPALRRTILICTSVPVLALMAWVFSRPPGLAYELELLRADGTPPAAGLVFAPGETLSARVQCPGGVHLSLLRIDAAGAAHWLAPLRVAEGKAHRLGPPWSVGSGGREDFFFLASRTAPPADLEAEALHRAREAFGGARARDDAALGLGRALSPRADVRWMVVDVRDPVPSR